MATGKARQSLFCACLRKLILLIPLIHLMPLFFENKVFAVFLAEPGGRSSVGHHLYDAVPLHILA